MNPELIIYPKLILTVVFCGMCIAVAIWRLFQLAVTGRLDMSPIFPNLKADFRANPIKLLLTSSLVVFFLALSALGLIIGIDIALGG